MSVHIRQVLLERTLGPRFFGDAMDVMGTTMLQNVVVWTHPKNIPGAWTFNLSQKESRQLIE
jgi:hypothetical protein